VRQIAHFYLTIMYMPLVMARMDVLSALAIAPLIPVIRQLQNQYVSFHSLAG